MTPLHIDKTEFRKTESEEMPTPPSCFDIDKTEFRKTERTDKTEFRKPNT